MSAKLFAQQAHPPTHRMHTRGNPAVRCVHFVWSNELKTDPEAILKLLVKAVNAPIFSPAHSARSTLNLPGHVSLNVDFHVVSEGE